MSIETGFTPHQLFVEMHVQQGRSHEASLFARYMRQQQNDQNFTNPEVAAAFGEYARIAVVTGLAAARKAPDWDTAQGCLAQTLDELLTTYPLAESEEEAQQRGDYWEAPYGEQSAHIMCLRDTYHLAIVLSRLLPHEDLEPFMGGITRVITDASENNERFGLIFLSEEAPYEQAHPAFQQFLHQYGLDSAAPDPNQLITVCSRMAGRALEERDLKTLATSWKTIIRTVQNDPAYLRFSLSELLKNTSKSLKNWNLNSKLDDWSVAAAQDNALHARTQRLIASRYVGLGQGIVETIT